jgi:hypothetical protein
MCEDNELNGEFGLGEVSGGYAGAVLIVAYVVAAVAKKSKLAQLNKLITLFSFAKCKMGGSPVK